MEASVTDDGMHFHGIDELSIGLFLRNFLFWSRNWLYSCVCRKLHWNQCDSMKP